MFSKISWCLLQTFRTLQWSWHPSVVIESMLSESAQESTGCQVIPVVRSIISVILAMHFRRLWAVLRQEGLLSFYFGCAATSTSSEAWIVPWTATSWWVPVDVEDKLKFPWNEPALSGTVVPSFVPVAVSR